jgi:hypothetical protein
VISRCHFRALATVTSTASVNGGAALPSLNSLVIVVVGRTPAQLATAVGSVKVTAIAATVPANPGGSAHGLRGGPAEAVPATGNPAGLYPAHRVFTGRGVD